MKKLIWLVLVFFAVPLMAQNSSDNYAMPEDVYKALAYAHEKAITYKDSLPDEEKQKLTPAKGLIFVQVGFPACNPCNEMVTSLENEGIISMWREQEVRFFKINVFKDRKRTDVPLTTRWNIKQVPVLMVLKDGKEVARKQGFHMDSSQEFLNTVRQLTRDYNK